MNSDWLQQVSRIEKSYESLFRDDANDVSLGNINGNVSGGGGGAILDLRLDSGADKSYHGINRFPPKPRPTALGGVDNERYSALASEARAEAEEQADKTGRRAAGAQLQSQLDSLLLSIRSNREQARARGTYLSNLPLTTSDAEAAYLSEVLMELRALDDEAVDYLRAVDVLQFGEEGTRTSSSSSSNSSSANVNPNSLLPAAADYCQALRTDASASAMYITSLIDQTEDMLYSPRGLVCRIDGLQPDWRAVEAVQRQLVATPVAARALRYANLVRGKNLPLCRDVYEFLCDPERQLGMLCVSNYKFREGELAVLLSFFATDTAVLAGATASQSENSSGKGKGKGKSQKPTVHTSHLLIELLLDTCSLRDADVYLISAYLPDFPALHTLSLRGNSITSAGLINLSTVIWEHGLALRVLQLDQNKIDSTGAMMLAKSLHRCRFLQRLSLSFNPIGDVGVYYLLRATMNPKRRARRTLPRPLELVSGELEEGNDDFQSDHESSSEEASVVSEDSEDNDDDAFTAVGDDESVYTQKASYIPSNTMNRKGLLAAERLRLSREADRHVHLTPLQRWFRRVRRKVQTIAFFLSTRSRGHNMHTLDLAGCGLGPFSVHMLSHCACDNRNLASINLSENALGSSEYEDVDNSDLFRLVVHSRVQSLYLRNASLFEHNVEAVVRGLNHISHLHLECYLKCIDISGNHLGPTGANLIACVPGFFVDQVSIGVGYTPNRQQQQQEPAQGGAAAKQKQKQALIGSRSAAAVPVPADRKTNSSQPGGGGGSSGADAANTSSSQIGGSGTGVVASENFDDKDNDFEGDDGKIFDIRLLALEQSQHQQKLLLEQRQLAAQTQTLTETQDMP